MNKSIEERAKKLYPESDNPILDELRERQRAAYIAGATENQLAEAGGWTRVEELVNSEPINFFMTNIMRYMNEEQIKVLIEKLIRRYPAPPTVNK